MTRRVAVVVAGVAVVTLSSRVTATIPGSAVPQSAQTLAVLVVGALLGARLAAATVGAWLLAGGVGLPVFADGASGPAHLVGSTAGYLLGFVLAATAVGRLADRTGLRRFGPALAAMIAGHALILGLGWARLAGTAGPGTAFRQGVEPFLWGGLLKSLVAALVAVTAARVAGLPLPLASATGGTAPPRRRS